MIKYSSFHSARKIQESTSYHVLPASEKSKKWQKEILSSLTSMAIASSKFLHFSTVLPKCWSKTSGASESKPEKSMVPSQQPFLQWLEKAFTLGETEAFSNQPFNPGALATAAKASKNPTVSASWFLSNDGLIIWSNVETSLEIW